MPVCRVSSGLVIDVEGSGPLRAYQPCAGGPGAYGKPTEREGRAS